MIDVFFFAVIILTSGEPVGFTFLDQATCRAQMAQALRSPGVQGASADCCRVQITPVVAPDVQAIL